jgi:hypothetical protein
MPSWLLIWTQGSVEFVAPVEYMVRPPQAPVYMFVIDVSMTAVASGVLQVRTALQKQGQRAADKDYYRCAIPVTGEIAVMDSLTTIEITATVAVVLRSSLQVTVGNAAVRILWDKKIPGVQHGVQRSSREWVPLSMSVGTGIVSRLMMYRVCSPLPGPALCCIHQTVCSAIKDALPKIPGGERTQASTVSLCLDLGCRFC